MEPFFSIIIPTYNRADHIIGTVNSVLNQSFGGFEILVIDDGSADNTDEVIKSISDSRIRYFKKANEERAAARNFGIARANGKYVTFLDSDDLLKKNHLQKAFEIIQSDPGIPVFHIAYDIVDQKGKLLRKPPPLDNPVNSQLIEGNFLSCLGVFIKYEVTNEFKFNEDRGLSGSEDYELWLRIASKYNFKTFAFYTASLVQHDERSMMSVAPDILLKRIDKLKHYVYKTEDFKKKYNKALNKFEAYLDIYLALHLLPYKIKSLKRLIRAIKYYPAVVLNRRFYAVIKNLILN